MARKTVGKKNVPLNHSEPNPPPMSDPSTWKDTPLVAKVPSNSSALSSICLDVPGGHDLSSYYSRDDERGTLRGMRDNDTIGASYDRFVSPAHAAIAMDALQVCF